MSEEEIMNEYEILKDQLFNERETYNFIDKLGYDDWNKKEVIRKYIKHIRKENQQLKERINTYENPEDLTLMFMYCDEKAKDKIKLYKSVLDEIREKIDFAKATIEYAGDCSDVGYNFLISADKIVEILDKAGKQ